MCTYFPADQIKADRCQCAMTIAADSWIQSDADCRKWWDTFQAFCATEEFMVICYR